MRTQLNTNILFYRIWAQNKELQPFRQKFNMNKCNWSENILKRMDILRLRATIRWKPNILPEIGMKSWCILNRNWDNIGFGPTSNAFLLNSFTISLSLTHTRAHTFIKCPIQITNLNVCRAWITHILKYT